MRYGSLRWLFGAFVAVLLMASGTIAAPTASAALESVDSSSCGLGGGTWTGSNGYCSFVDGTDIVIGPNSCNVLNSCTDLGAGVRINPFGLPWFEGSCNYEFACGLGGGSAGAFEVGGGSCNDDHACYAAGEGGKFKAGLQSCNGGYACAFNGQDSGDFTAGSNTCNEVTACQSSGLTGGFVKIGNNSCDGNSACYRTGPLFIAGHGTCNGYEACYSNGMNASFDVENGSCNGAYACRNAGADGYGPPSVGNFSCNEEREFAGSGTFATQCTASSSSAQPPVGDCMYNDVLPTSAEVACLFAGVPSFGALAGVLQSILAIFALF